jgi:hypothetical protein
MAYQFLQEYRWSPNGVKINTYKKGSIHEELPEKLIEACDKEKYPLLKEVNPKNKIEPEFIEGKIEDEPENKMEPAPEKKGPKHKKKK